MDPVFDAHYRIIEAAFAEAGTRLEIAYTPSGEVDYICERGRLLVAAPNDDFAPLADRLRGAEVIGGTDSLAVVSIDNLSDGHLSVPDALDLLDPIFHADDLPAGGMPRVTPNHLFEVQRRLCQAIEPEVPSGPTQPWPPRREPTDDEQPVRIGMVDSGLVKPVDPALTWLSGVDGDDDPLGPTLPGGLPLIPPFACHGTFCAGVARSTAPRSDIFVGNELDIAGATLESKIINKVEQLITQFNPPIINVSSGTYTRRNWAPLAFEGFFDRHPDLTLVAAAGNDATNRPCYPGAFPFPGAISVGALGPDQVNLAWFSNYGPWVDVYTQGEGIVNAFAVGQYRYHVPPKAPARQDFRAPLARWDGTSFAAPRFSGAIASRMGRTGQTSRQAAEALLNEAGQNSIPGLGPALLMPWAG
jgi:hypothetical protein